jgi:C-terminal processing protease CtpA/Prc
LPLNDARLQRDVRVSELVPGGPAAKLGYVHVGDAVVAIDDQPIPPDIPAPDLHAYVLSRGDARPRRDQGRDDLPS